LDVGLYLHVPFCPTKCGYCDFYSHVPQAGMFAPLVNAMLAELDATLAGGELRVETIFVGGGTPTFLPMSEFEKVFARLGQIAERDRPVEFTVEANPASLTAAKAAVLRVNGVNRVSMGAQSFDPHELRTLERIHSPADIAPSAAIIRNAGFEHFNLDLIFGIPGQTEASWSESLRKAIDLGPDHLACYGLTYEPDTTLRDRLEQGMIEPVQDEYEAVLYGMAVDTLDARGFRQYEISNFAREQAESRHNLRYWLNLPYVGVGPSAASFLHGRRWKNVADTAEYVRRAARHESLAGQSEELSALERAGETAMLQLRLVRGIDRAEFRAATGYDPHELFAEAIATHAGRGLLKVDGGRIALTRQGRLVGDAVIADFLCPAS
jgi:oxygen-independent coproporphyrinogen III oxidase